MTFAIRVRLRWTGTDKRPISELRVESQPEISKLAWIETEEMWMQNCRHYKSKENKCRNTLPREILLRVRSRIARVGRTSLLDHLADCVENGPHFTRIHRFFIYPIWKDSWVATDFGHSPRTEYIWFHISRHQKTSCSTFFSTCFWIFPPRKESIAIATFSEHNRRRTGPMLASRKGMPYQVMLSSTILVNLVLPRKSVWCAGNKRLEGPH